MYSVCFDHRNPLDWLIFSFAMLGALAYLASVLVLYHLMIHPQERYVKITYLARATTLFKACFWPLYLVYYTCSWGTK